MPEVVSVLGVGLGEIKGDDAFEVAGDATLAGEVNQVEGQTVGR
jgi:hypothetical protein